MAIYTINNIMNKPRYIGKTDYRQVTDTKAINFQNCPSTEKWQNMAHSSKYECKTNCLYSAKMLAMKHIGALSGMFFVTLATLSWIYSKTVLQSVLWIWTS